MSTDVSPHEGRSRFLDLLVVVFLTMVGAPVLYAALGGGHRERRRSYCMRNMKQIGSALLMYTQDYDERYPPDAYQANGQTHAVPHLLHPYLKNPSVFECIFDRGGGNRFDGTPGNTRVSYGYNWLALAPRGVGVFVKDVGDPAGTLGFVEASSYRAAPEGLSLPEPTRPAYQRRHRPDGAPGTHVGWLDGRALWAKPAIVEAKKRKGGVPGTISKYLWWDLKKDAR